MLIICPNCATTYQVPVETVGDSGRPVRCARCLTEWVAHRPKIIPALAQAPDLELVAAGPIIPPLDRHIDRRPKDEDSSDGESRQSATAATDGIDVDSLQDDLADNPTGEQETARHEADRMPAESSGDVTLAEAPSIVPAQAPDSESSESGPTPPKDIEVVAARRFRRVAPRRKVRTFSRAHSRVYYAVLALALCNAALLLWRENVVRLLPQTASLYAAIGLPVNLRGLVFADVHTSMETRDGVNVLIIDGAVIAQTKTEVAVPRLRFAVRNQSGNEIYAWTAKPARPVIAPDERLPFRSRLASPPGETARVEVRFLTRADLSRGIP